MRAAKQVLHVPIAERYLVMSLGLLTQSPAVVLWALGIVSVIALSWTQTGRLLRAVTGRDGFDPARPDPQLADLCDLAVLPRPSGRGRLAWQLPGGCCSSSRPLRCCSRPVPTSRRGPLPTPGWPSVCWHVYDNVYRLRETGSGCAAWLRRATGVEVRVVVLALIGGASSHARHRPARRGDGARRAATPSSPSWAGARHLRPPVLATRQDGRS